MSGSRERAYLQQQLVHLLASQPEIYHIATFGREADGTPDDYSDIDLIACSFDPATTQRHYRHLLSTISPIRSTWLIESTARQFAEMIQLEAYSPYQKIDFSIARTPRDKADFAPLRVLYTHSQSEQCCPTTYLTPIPYRKDAAYRVQEILFSVARFTKCLFRQDIDMYRRWRSITNATLVLLAEKYTEWQLETTKKQLTAHEMKVLSACVNCSERRALQTIFPPHGHLDLAASYRASIHLFIELSQQKADVFAISLDTAFIEYIDVFMERELQRYAQSKNIAAKIM